MKANFAKVDRAMMAAVRMMCYVSKSHFSRQFGTPLDPQSTGLEFTEARCSSDSRKVRDHPAFLYLIAALADENLAGSDELVIDSPPDLSPEVYTPSYVWREARYCTEYLTKYNFVMARQKTAQ